MLKKYTLSALLFASTSLFAATPATSSAPKISKPQQQCRIVRHCEHTCTNKRVCIPQKSAWKQTGFDDINNAEESALAIKLRGEGEISKYGISFDEPTYILPFYYTASPYQDVGPTPNNQGIMNEELKAQLSFKFDIWPKMFGSTWGIGASYTQLSYWQVYAKSQFFRETDYEPALFVQDQFLPHWLASLGAVHQSNGRGGQFERSWNRAYFNLAFSGRHWLVRVEPWILIFKKESSDLHNKDIAKYLGYERIVVAYKYHSQEFSAVVRNSFESGFQRMALELGYEFPIYLRLHGYVQYFYGYGQSLIEYNHKTNAAGIGIALSNWI